MLSADVPEFVPRAYQNLGSTSTTAAAKPEEKAPQPQQTTCSPRGYKPTPSSRFSHTRAPQTSWREGREAESGFSHISPKQNDSWRRSGKESGSWREGQALEGSRHESGTEALPETYPGSPKTPEKQIVPKGRGRGRGKHTSTELESQIRNKFVTASKNRIHSYTQILKHKPTNNKPEATASKQDFSLKVDSQWPILGGSQPQYVSSQGNESAKIESVSNPWEGRSSEVSPAKSPPKNPQNPWQERCTAEPTPSVAVRPKVTKEHPKPSENAGKINQVTLKLQRHPEIKASPNDSKRLEGTRKPALSNLNNDERQIQISNARSASNIGDDNPSGTPRLEEPVTATENSTANDDSDPFQWKVIGEKKKVKVKEEEAHGSPRLRKIRDDDKKLRNPPDKSSPRFERKQPRGERKQPQGERKQAQGERKQAHENSGKLPKSAVVRMLKNNSLRSSSHEKHEESKEEDSSALKSGLREGKKSRPTKVASLANCRSDTREMRYTAKKSSSTAVETAKPVDEKTLQKRLAAKLLKQEEKKKKRERKAKEELVQNRPKDTRVSFITTDFLETCNQEAPNQTSAQHQPNRMTFTSEEYPALQMQRNIPPRLPSRCATQPNTKSWPDRTNKKTLSTQIKVQGNDPVPRHKRADPHTAQKGAGAWGQQATTYKTALLAAKEKEANVMPAVSSTEEEDYVPFETVKKNVKTTDRIELDIFALAAHTSAKKKKKELLQEALLFTKRKPLEEENDPAGKTGLNKAAAVVVKRGKISAKPKKKKVSRIKKCQMEKRQRDILALQLLLQQAKLRTEQQMSLEAPPTTHLDAEESCKEVESVENSVADERLSPTLTTEQDEEKPDDKESQSSTSEARKGENEKEENKENTGTSETPHSTLNTNHQISCKKTPNDKDDKKTKIVWILNKTENVTPQSEAQSTNSGMKTESSGDDKPCNLQPTEEGSPTSPAQKEDLMKDPLVVKRASELISFVKSQSLSEKASRKYIHQVVTSEVNEVAKELMKSLITFQARHYQREPVKARIKRRYVCGLKETTKLMGKMSCVIMAPNIDQCEGPGSLDDAVEKLLNQAEKYRVPVVFALSTRVMRKLCHKNGKRVSCFGIISYQGAQDLFKRLMELLPEAQKQYQELVSCGQCSVPREGDDDDDEEEEENKEGKQEVKKDLTEEIIAHTNALLMSS